MYQKATHGSIHLTLVHSVIIDTIIGDVKDNCVTFDRSSKSIMGISISN